MTRGGPGYKQNNPRLYPTPPKKPFSPIARTRTHPSYLSLRIDTTNHHIKHNRPLNNMMDVTFVLEESGVTATVEVPCEAKVAAAKEVACTALAVSPASVEMRIGTQVLEGTCRLQDTAFEAGVQVVLARPRFADIKCPAQYSVQEGLQQLSLSPCGTLCLYRHGTHVGGLDTETFNTAFAFSVGGDCRIRGPPAISRCKTHCYLACEEELRKVALPGGEVLRKVDGTPDAVFACDRVVVSKGNAGVSVYDEDLTLLRSLSHGMCWDMAVSPCGGWVITSSRKEDNVRLWDVNTGEAVACVPAEGWQCRVALSRSASVFAVGEQNTVQLFDWSGAALRSVDVGGSVDGIQFTPCGKYLVASISVSADDDTDTNDGNSDDYEVPLHQYDVETMSCVRVVLCDSSWFAISPCSRVLVSLQSDGGIVTRHLYPHNSE